MINAPGYCQTKSCHQPVLTLSFLHCPQDLELVSVTWKVDLINVN